MNIKNNKDTKINYKKYKYYGQYARKLAKKEDIILIVMKEFRCQ